ncbi:MAG: hypothetical protein JHC93_02975 [Parachlamydiales bacterium]|nr:hypothetical protein [Parachlamydiales bacterium]
MINIFFISFVLLTSCLSANTLKQRQTLFYSLDPTSVAQALSFFELYPETDEGKKALHRAWILLTQDQIANGEKKLPEEEISFLPLSTVFSLITLVDRVAPLSNPSLDTEVIQLVDRLGHNLCNRKLKGFHCLSAKDIIDQQNEDIDLARGLLLTQLGDDPEALKTISQYEALLDMMALQIRARLPKDATPHQIIEAMNALIFYDLHFKFPPHSVYADDIDLYTFLPAVLDSRRGVCLGVSILYLSIAQRLDLPLEIITPPGHIYVRHRNGDDIVNIETTARGINIPTKAYLSINTRSLLVRTIKEVIGFAFVNQASVYSQQEKYDEAVSCYEKGYPFLSHDPLMIELLGYHYLMNGDKKKGEKLLHKLDDIIPEHLVSKETIAEDYFKGRVNSTALKVLFKKVDETQESLEAKKNELQNVVKKYPKFRQGLFQLATLWLQLKRNNEALIILEKLHTIDDQDPTVEYYLAALNAERWNYPKAWQHLLQAEKIVKERNHSPQALKELRINLKALNPQ